jgi:hypothetical protein
MDSLPREIILHILHYTDPEALCALGSTCKRLYETSICDSIWARHCHKYGVYEYNPNADDARPVNYRQIYIRLLHRYGWILGIWQGEYLLKQVTDDGLY